MWWWNISVCIPTWENNFSSAFYYVIFFPDKDRTLVSNLFLGTKLSKWVLCLNRSLIIWLSNCVSAIILEKLLQTLNEDRGPYRTITMENLFTGCHEKRHNASLYHHLSEQWQPGNSLPMHYSLFVTTCASSCPSRCLACVKLMIQDSFDQHCKEKYHGLSFKLGIKCLLPTSNKWGFGFFICKKVPFIAYCRI